MSGGGGDKPKEVKASEGEKIQAQLAKDQIAYYRSTYAPLEKEFVKEANQDHSAKLSAQAAIGANREVTGAMRSMIGRPAPVDTAALSGAVTSGRVAGMAEGVRQQADSRLDALKIGLGVTADASRSLSQAGSIQTGAAIDNARLEIAKQQEKSSMKEGIVGGLASAGGMYLGYKLPQWQQSRLTQQKALATADEQATKIANGTAYRSAQGFN